MLNFLGVVLISCAISQNNAAEFLMYADKKINAGIIEVNVENVILLNHENVCSIKYRNFFCFFNFFQIKIVAIDFLDFLNIKAFQQLHSVSSIMDFHFWWFKISQIFGQNSKDSKEIVAFCKQIRCRANKTGHDFQRLK